jgi:hypothetical protein
MESRRLLMKRNSVVRDGRLSTTAPHSRHCRMMSPRCSSRKSERPRPPHLPVAQHPDPRSHGSQCRPDTGDSASNFFQRLTDAADTPRSALAAAIVNPAPAPNQSAHAATAPARAWTTSSGEFWKPEDTGLRTTDPDENGFVGRLRAFAVSDTMR